MKKTIGLMLVLFVLILGGCGFLVSEDDAVMQTLEVTENMFLKNEAKANYDTDSFSLYLPESMEISEESQSNLILKEDGQTFILFYNPKEERTSKLNYQAATEKDEHLLLEPFEDEGRFGYVRVLPVNEDEQYELQVGIGGVKVTTYTEKEDLDKDAGKMMEIANSIAY